MVPARCWARRWWRRTVFDNQFLLPFAPETPGLLPDPGQQPGDGALAAVQQRDHVAIRSSPIANAPTHARRAPCRTRSTIRTTGSSTSRATGSIAAGSTRRTRSQLLAQFDYAGTFISDFQGQVNPTAGCAPEIGIDRHLTARLAFDSAWPPGVPRGPRTWMSPLVGPIVQVQLAPTGRSALATGNAILLEADTAVTGQASGCLDVRQRGGVRSARHRRAVRLRRRDRPQQPALLLLGDGVRRQLVPVGPVQPRVAAHHQVGDAVGEPRPTSIWLPRPTSASSGTTTTRFRPAPHPLV